MSKRFIGIDLEGTEVRVVVLQMDAGKIRVDLERRAVQFGEESRAALLDILDGKTALTDPVGYCPAGAGWPCFDGYTFPSPKRKISGLLYPWPCRPNCLFTGGKAGSSLAPRPCDNDYEVDAVVVNKLEIADLLDHFPNPEQNPRSYRYLSLCSVAGSG